MEISVSSEIKRYVPRVALGTISYTVEVEKSNTKLLEHFEKAVIELQNQYKLENIAEIPHIKETRNAYKALGKSPSQYRNAAEAMLRRIVKGNGLYHINNVVEINNLISVTSGYSVGSYDIGCIFGNAELRRAPDGEKYKGIGKDAVNIEHLPVLYDEEGAFGNPTSDSRRAMIQDGKRKVISFIYAFDYEKDELDNWLTKYRKLLELYTDASDICIDVRL
ncbi:B3/4 domain protein [Sporotomaculum syntrophicum]|uniref:B3/4 domain protein n=1 Tax=Sporotomaculum syntrophicum TaxID=182264 RepID=A0A9D3AXZ3_9FIRM|nr:phenylalanine--tRNA ligase beta subunit-related protein [Sporotomaculum syntrophicum]KAF1085512.1 B3/4 domain protein [Sporotomaculum syntrophicum]